MLQSVNSLLIIKQISFFFVFLLISNTGYSFSKENDNLRVYLDCQTTCDTDFIKREIQFVDYVNDRFQSNVYVLINSQETGSGGREYTLQFSGRENFEGQKDVLSFIREATATNDEYRTALVHNLKMGLVSYLAKTEKGKNLQISYTGESTSDAGATAEAEKDPWNLWVFNLRLNAFMNGDQNYFSNTFSTGISASRVTEDLKTSTTLRYSVNENRYGEGEDAFRFSNETFNGRNTTVWSLTDHWSAGGFVSAQKSDYSNYDSYLSVASAIEYNIFPYEESNNHYLGLMYMIGPRYFNYKEETIFFETEELRFHQNLSLDVSFNKKWGQIRGSATFGHYFHDYKKNRLSFSGYADLRLYKGLSLNFSGFYALQRDQLNIAKGNISNEDLLTRRRQLDSNYSFYTSFGIRYRFGSLFNNVVNPRFEGGGGMF